MQKTNKPRGANRGKFIVLEGCEGAGKSTQIEKLQQKFGDQVVTTREPGGTPFAEVIRSLILSPAAKNADGKTQFGLFWAARAEHMKNKIIPALKEGKHVICDRFDSSSYIYQIYGQEDNDLKDLFFHVRDVYLGDYTPDAYIFMDVDPKTGIKRKKEQDGVVLNHFDQRDLSFHKRVKQGLEEFFSQVGCEKIDANQSFTKVHNTLFKKINSIISV
jgi:dTMP kinase